MNNDWREFTGDPSYLAHHGIKGQKWGVRRYQNADGTLTSEGKQHYGAASGKVQKYATKAAGWERRAVNAKTGIGREFSTSMAVWRRSKADKTADKATGNYHMLHLNENAARSSRSFAESHANIAKGLKDRSENANSEMKKKILMERAIKNLARAENGEIAGKTYQAVANSPFLRKGIVLISSSLKSTTYTSAGRGKNFKDKFAESLGDQIISSVVKNKANEVNEKIDNSYKLSDKQKHAAKIGTNVASNIAGRGVVSNGRDIYYRAKNSQQKRWDKLAKG